MAQPKLVKDIEARVKKSGDTMTGNLTGKYFQGTWLQTTSVGDLGSSPSKIAVISNDGWIYYRTPSELANDIGLTGNYVLKTGDTITGELYVDGGTTLASLLVNGDARFVNTIQGSISGNAATATISTKLGTATVGSSVKPIYLNAGTATASTSTIGSSTKPIYMSNGTITACGNSLDVSITGSALTMKIKRVSEQITTIAAKVAIDTEAVYFCGSDGITFGCPQTHCIINIKKGDNHRTIMDCYHLSTGDHYINGCMHADGINDVWTGWILQPNPSQITNLQVAIDDKLAKTDGYAGSSSAGGSANSAVKLDTTTAGDSNTPVYFSEGKPVACTSLGLNTSGNAASASKVNNKLTVGSKTFDGSKAVTINAGDLGLASAMLFLGTTTTAIIDGATTNPITIGGESKTVTAGNVVLYGSKEFVWNGSAWEELGNEGSYKVVQSAVADPSASGTSNDFIATISQDFNGNISVSKKTVAVTNNNSTLAWGTTSTIGSVAGTNLQVTMPTNPNTDTKNTAGSTDTSSKIYLIGATSQTTNPQTYSDDEIYATSGVLTTKKIQVGGTAATIEYDSTNKCINFVFT